MTLSKRQKDAFLDCNSRINLLEGSVRSGKSFVAYLIFLQMLRTGPKGNYCCVGRSERTIQQNIIDPLQELTGGRIQYKRGIGEFELFGRKVYCIGANDERAEAKIRGATYAGALVDELTIIPQSFFKMLLSRLSVDGAKIIATTNPDNPFHWLKTDFIDRQDELDMTVISFRLDDNPSLSKTFIDSLKLEYTGVWFKRYIEGLWVRAEGLVYDFFDTEIHIVTKPHTFAKEYFVGVDYGTRNPFGAVLVGYNDEATPSLWIEKEYYFDSKKAGYQRTDSEYVVEMERAFEGYPISLYYIDPSALSFITEMKRNHKRVIQADNSVSDGIRYVSSLLHQGDLKICKCCTNLIKEFHSYSWDNKLDLKGKEKVFKENDHCFVAGTQVLTKKGYQNIEEISAGELVKTRSGWNRVQNNFIQKANVCTYNILGKNITCTTNHLFLTLDGWKESSSLIQSDILFVELEDLPWLKQSDLEESNIDAIHALKTLVTNVITEQEKEIASKDIAISIEIFGNTTMEKYHKDAIFIISTRTPITTTLAISNVYHLVNTFPFMERIVRRSKEKLIDYTLKRSDPSQRNGTQVKRGENGIKYTQKNPWQKGQSITIDASNVGKSINQNRKEQVQDFVRIIVKVHGEELITLMMNKENAYFAENQLHVTNIQKKEHAISIVHQDKENVRNVYNLHVENEHEYFVEGILVHNCMDAMRYIIFSRFGKKHKLRKQEKDLSPEQKHYNRNPMAQPGFGGDSFGWQNQRL